MSAIAPPLTITWSLPAPDFDPPTDPVENSEQDPLATALRQAIWGHATLGDNALIGSNFSICATVNGKTVCKAPDWMYVQPVELRPRRSYTPHVEGPVPRIVMEFVSDNRREEYDATLTPEKIGRWAFYQDILAVPYYVIFDPQGVRLEVYRLDEAGQYQPDPISAEGMERCVGGHDIHWIDSMELYLGIWHGTRENRTGAWLRWWDAAGHLLLWPEEVAELERQRAELERQRAEDEQRRAEAADQQAELDRQRAEAADRQAELDRQRAEAADHQAELDRQRAEAADRQAEAAQQEADRLRRLLQERGIDLDS